MKNLPEKIYPNFGDMSEEEFENTAFEDCAEVTWSKDEVQGRNVEYIRKNALLEWLKGQKEKFKSDYLHGRSRIMRNLENSIK